MNIMLLQRYFYKGKVYEVENPSLIETLKPIFKQKNM